MWIAFDTCWLLTAALFYGQISYLTHQRVGILHTLLRTDSKSDTLLLREERAGLSLAENKVKLRSILLFSLSCQINEVISRQCFTRNAVNITEEVSSLQ